MKRTKTATKAKEPVRIRFKELSNGNKSIYLDIYREGKRSYEFLKLYLVPEKTQSAKLQNAQTLRAANAIKAQRVIELSNEAAGIKDLAKSKMLLCDWLDIFIEQKSQTVQERTLTGIQYVKKLLGEYGSDLQMRHVDKNYCLGFFRFLRLHATKNRHKRETFSDASIRTFSVIFNEILNAAVRQDIISENPFSKIDSTERPRKVESNRDFLTIEEVRKLIDTPCHSNSTKQAFLFSCFCGLRYSDIRSLTWGNIEESEGRYYANIVMQKTQEPLYLPLNQQAMSFIPERRIGWNSTDLVFPKLVNPTTVNLYIHRWAKSAGITKNVTFHVARHTFATISLTLGADLYTTSKLLGHKNVSTTEIYAKIINKKKEAAVDLFKEAF